MGVGMIFPRRLDGLLAWTDDRQEEGRKGGREGWMKTKTIASSRIIPTHSASSTATAASTTAAPVIATATHPHPSSSTSSSSTTNTTTAAKTKEEEEEEKKKTEEEAERAKKVAQEELKEAYRVVDLPGLPSDVEFADQYAGYIPVESPAVNGTSSLPPSLPPSIHPFCCYPTPS